jgi:tetratricopeptide (TPR) repeat protein
MTSDAERVTELYRIGRGLLAAGEPAEAVPVLEEAQAKAQTASPGEVVAQSIDLNLALALARTLPDPQSSDAADPTDSPTQIARVRGLVSEGLAVGPTAPVDVIAGRALLLVGDEEQATSLFRQAIHLDPLLPDAYLALGDWYESKGMKLLPLHLYAQAVKALPDNPQIAVAYAIAAYRAEAPTEALPILQQTAEMPTDDPYLFAFLGDCYLDLGMAVQAQAAYEEGLQRAPNAKPLVDRLHTLDKWMKAHNG